MLKKKIILLTVCAFVLCMGLVACGEKADDKDKFLGTWELESAEASGETGDGVITSEDILTLKEEGPAPTLTLTEVDTATMDLFGDYLEGTWEVTGTDSARLTIDEKTSDMSIVDGKLVVAGSGYSMKFTHVDQ